MCPMCVGTGVALIAAATTSIGGLGTLIMATFCANAPALTVASATTIEQELTTTYNRGN